MSLSPPPPVPPGGPVPVVGIVCINASGAVCLIQRGKPPNAGAWTLPGGRIERGEKAADAALRELKEETGLDGTLLGLLDVVDGLFASRRTGELGHHYLMVDYAARAEGVPRGADDALDAAWFTREAIGRMGLWDETLRIIDMGLARAALTPP